MSSAASNYCPEEGCKGSPTDLAWGPEGSSDSWLEDDLGLLFSEDGTDWEGDAPEEVTRGQHRVDPRLKKHWENIGSILDGLTPRSNTLGRSSVQPSCVIDFQYYDKPPQNRQGDYLNLADGLLERAYFFRIPRDHGNQLRLALHAHTFVKWSERRNGPLKDPSLRANEITSVNVRIAEKTSVGKKVNGKEKFEFHEAPAGFPMLPRSKDLQKNWRQYFREEGGKQHKDVQWKWTDEEHFPFGEVHLAQDEDQKAYSRIRKLIQIADEFLRNNPPPPETTSPRQTRKKIRGSNSTVQEIELIAMRRPGTDEEGSADPRQTTSSAAGIVSSPTTTRIPLNIDDKEAREFWEKTFSSAPSVPWHTFCLNLEDDFEEILETCGREGKEKLRKKLEDASYNGDVSMVHFNIFTRKAGLEASLKRCATTPKVPVVASPQAAEPQDTFTMSIGEFEPEMGFGGGGAPGKATPGAPRARAVASLKPYIPENGVVVLGSDVPAKPSDKVVALFLGANNQGCDQLELDNERKNLDKWFTNVHGVDAWGDNAFFCNESFATTDDLIDQVERKKPTILHFACHGEDKTLKLYGEDKGLANLADLMKLLNEEEGHIRLVIVNACHSYEIARAFAEHVDFAIGHYDEVEDAKAVQFSQTLYALMGDSANSIRRCFNLARRLVEDDNYVLFERKSGTQFHFPRPVTQQEKKAKEGETTANVGKEKEKKQRLEENSQAVKQSEQQRHSYMVLEIRKKIDSDKQTSQIMQLSTYQGTVSHFFGRKSGPCSRCGKPPEGHHLSMGTPWFKDDVSESLMCETPEEEGGLCAGNKCLGCPLPNFFMFWPMHARMVCYMMTLMIPISIITGLNAIDLDSTDRKIAGNGFLGWIVTMVILCFVCAPCVWVRVCKTKPEVQPEAAFPRCLYCKHVAGILNDVDGSFCNTCGFPLSLAAQFSV